MNLINSLVRFSLHPTNGTIHDYKTGKAHKIEEGHLDDGMFVWNLKRLRDLLTGNKHVEDAIVAPSSFEAHKERMKAMEPLPFAPPVTDQGQGAGTASADTGMSEKAPAPDAAAPLATTGVSGSSSTSVSAASDEEPKTDTGSLGSLSPPSGLLMNQPDEPSDAPSGSGVPPEAPTVDEPPTEASHDATDDAEAPGTS